LGKKYACFSFQNLFNKNRTFASARRVHWLQIRHKCICGRGFDPDPAGCKAYNASWPLAGFNRERTRKGRKWRGENTHQINSWLYSCYRPHTEIFIRHPIPRTVKATSSPPVDISISREHTCITPYTKAPSTKSPKTEVPQIRNPAVRPQYRGP